MPTVLERAIDWGTRIDARPVTYAFAPAGGPYATLAGPLSGYAWTAYEQAQVDLAFSLYRAVLDVAFVEVTYGEATPDLLLINADAGDMGGTLGFFAPPGVAFAGVGAFNWQGRGWDWATPGAGALEQGGFGFVTIIHELGHALGLAHPHDRGGGSAVFPGVGSAFGDYGVHDLNQGIYTTMSYNGGWATAPFGSPSDDTYGLQGTPGAIDIAVLQAKYGANRAFHAGDDVYRLPDANRLGTFFACLWDAGGVDAIVHDGGAPVVIDLRAATLAVEPGGGGFLSFVRGVFGGFTIARGSVIENASGGAGDDLLTGNQAPNELRGGGGKDSLAGRAHDDRLLGAGRADILLGGRGSDLLDGGGGRDVLRGGTAADRLIGGAGSDRLAGGAGGDAFVFDVPPRARAADTVADFRRGRDEIWLDQDAFGALGPAGTLKAGKFSLGSAAEDRSDRIVYDEDSGRLLYDADGPGGKAAKLVARLLGDADVDHADFLIVG